MIRNSYVPWRQGTFDAANPISKRPSSWNPQSPIQWQSTTGHLRRGRRRRVVLGFPLEEEVGRGLRHTPHRCHQSAWKAGPACASSASPLRTRGKDQAEKTPLHATAGLSEGYQSRTSAHDLYGIWFECGGVDMSGEGNKLT